MFVCRYVRAWHEYSQGVAYLNCLYSYLNLQHVKRQKVYPTDNVIIAGILGRLGRHPLRSQTLRP